MGYIHFIWDFDGTLYDTYQGIVAAVAMGLFEMGLPLPEKEEVARLAKTTLRHACVALAGKERARELLARYAVHAADMGIAALSPYPGCLEALEKVVASGGFNYLYTHRNRQAVEALERDGMASLFRDFITIEAGFPHKPAPDALNWLARQHGLDPASCVMIGDRPIDIQAGHSAGMAAALFDPEGYFKDSPSRHVFKFLPDVAEAFLG